ncbi:hypothetical protein OIU84_027551 [Salix udensis]|uniref:Syntaxin N-terminal domain-containing protein n=1 Tax=Salix udensis TaxID=889485 RepID=A0AAD6PB31_9ROSI|nr:hypothetical protein OIU84_027551 [Salix udensis]
MSEFLGRLRRENIHQEYREVVERAVFTVTGTRADEETIDKLIETGDSEQHFRKQFRTRARPDNGYFWQKFKSAMMLSEIWRGNFWTYNSLGGCTRDMLDNIESQVSNAVDHVQSGNVASPKRQRSCRGNLQEMRCIRHYNPSYHCCHHRCGCD